jgi:predicted SprT family Zn-dependent metalloprotease
VNKPTEEYVKYQQAYDYFNGELFDGHLPPCLITLQHKRGIRGYYWSSRFAARNNPTLRTDEIALNPDTFAGYDDKSICGVLVHEMAHLCVAHEGKPSRGGYHNRKWARKMLQVGLWPISLDHPGKMTGYRVVHEIMPGGPFDVAANQLLTTGFCLRWQSGDMIALSGNNATLLELVRQKRNKTKYTCPECGQNVWAKPHARLICGNCTDTRELKRYIPLAWLT